MKIAQAQFETERQDIHDIFWEYLQWANDRNDEEFGIRLDIEAMIMATLDKYEPPRGRLLLARVDGAVVGCICLQHLVDDIAEVKRLYVRPDFRQRGIGSALVKSVADEARQAGYKIIRLDSANYMTNAHAVYQAHGFSQIEPYPESEIPAEYHHLWVFMENRLSTQ